LTRLSSLSNFYYIQQNTGVSKVSRIAFPLLVISVLLFCISNAQAAWKVELVSGVTLSANSYHIDKRRIYLEYPVGEVSFRLSELKSVSQDNQGVDLFQANGIRQEKQGPQPKESLAKVEPNRPAAATSAVSHARGSPSSASSRPAPSAIPDVKGGARPRFTAAALDGLARNAVTVNDRSGYYYDPQIEEVVDGVENAGGDEAKLAAIQAKMDKLFDSQ
jgi:hypothetical protein